MIKIVPLQVAYMPLPKAACTSVKKALALLDPAVDPDALPGCEDEGEMWHAIYPTQRFRPHRWNTVPRSWFGFTVLRDPLSRLLACYTDRVIERRELHHSRKLRKGTYNLSLDPDPDFFFQNLQAYREASSIVKHHSLNTWLFTGRNLMVYSKVYTVERMTELQCDLSTWLDRPVAFGRENATQLSLSEDDLSPKTWEALRPWLEQEYAFLRDYYDPPPAMMRPGIPRCYKRAV